MPGTLDTHVSSRGARLRRLEPIRIELHLGDGIELLSRHAHHTLGHLPGPTGSKELEWFIRAQEGAACRLLVRGGTGGNVAADLTLPAP